jgi:CHAT domain-containing protein
VHYFYGQQNIYSLVVTGADHAEVYDLGPTIALEPSIRSYLDFFQSSKAIENDPQEYLRLAHELYRQLLEPLDLPSAEELLIYPDGALAYLPFESLVTKPAEHLSAAEFLLQDYIIRYAYSAAILKQQTDRSATGKATLAAFAPFAQVDAASSFAQLDYSNDEISRLRSSLKGDFWLNERATLSRFERMGSQYEIIHLSTHAFSSASAGQPRIAFVDSILYLDDLYHMDLLADLVVLSACQTSIGPLAPGEGVLSLGRGFTHAGARSLVSSLWKVNARATGTVLAAFYEQLQQGTPKYKALHLAKTNYLANPALASYERSPYYWAGLVYYGGRENLIIEEKGNLFLYGLLVVGLALLLIVGVSLWRRSQSI